MTDSILRAYYTTTSLTQVPFPFTEVAEGALGLLTGEADGFAIDATTADGGTVAVINTGDPGDNLSNVILDASNLVNSGTSAKMVHHLSSPYVRWSAHNMFLNSGAPATQNVTLVVGFVYTVTVTGAGGGSITGSAGASGVATTGSPATFTATTTTGTFTYAATLTTIQLNRGTIATPYLATTGAIRIGIPQSYDTLNTTYGILSELAATNISQYSEKFDNAYWQTASNVTITADNTTAPDGSTTADRFTEVATTATHRVASNNNATSTVSSATNYTLSCYVKQGTRQWVRFQVDDGGGANVQEWFDVQNGVVGSTSITGSNILRDGSTITNIGGGWYRCTLTIHTGGAVTDVIWYHGLSDADASVAYLGVITEYGYFWGSQFERGIVATSYVPTLGATATRAADLISAAGTTIPTMSTELGMWWSGKFLVYAGVGNALLGVSDSSSSDNASIFPQGGNNPRVYCNSVGVDQCNISLGTLTPPSSAAKLAGRWKANDFHGAFNGTLAGTPDTTGSMPVGINMFRFSEGDGTSGGQGQFIYQMVLVPRIYSDAELQALTT